VRHLGEVHEDGSPGDVAAERDVERVRRGRSLGGRQQVAKGHERAALVRHLDADRRATGNGRENPYVSDAMA